MTSILVSTWSDGLFTLSPAGERQDFEGRCVAGLAPDGPSGAVAVVDGSTVVRRSPDGTWSPVGISEMRIVCCLAVDGVVYAGTEGAHLLRMREGRPLERIAAFDEIEGRDEWFAGFAIIDGKKVGPPLAVRSLAGSRDGDLLLAGVHVGGIARSVDRGVEWRPTIDIDWDVHEVCVHPAEPDVAIAAAAVGLCVSMDGGATWELDRIGTEENHCSAVAFTEDDVAGDILVSVSRSPFAEHGSVLRRPIAAPGALETVGGGLPDRLDGIVDTGCIAANGSDVAVVDSGGNVYASRDGGDGWTRLAEGIPAPSGAVIVRHRG